MGARFQVVETPGQKLTWQAAAAAATLLTHNGSNGRLAVLNTQERYNTAIAALEEYRITSGDGDYPTVWVGLSDTAEEGTWIWADGTPLENGVNNIYWADSSDLHGGSRNEPSNSGQGEDFAVILGSERSQPGKYSDDDGDLSNTSAGRYGYLVEFFVPDPQIDEDLVNEVLDQNLVTQPDQIVSNITDFIPYDDFKETGVTLADSFDSWRRKINGITKHITQERGVFAKCLLRRDTESPYNWYLDIPSSRNIQSFNVKSTSSRIAALTFNAPRSHTDHIIFVTGGRDTDDNGSLSFNDFATIAREELTGLWFCNLTNFGFDIGHYHSSSHTYNRGDEDYYRNGGGSVFNYASDVHGFNEISIIVY